MLKFKYSQCWESLELPSATHAVIHQVYANHSVTIITVYTLFVLYLLLPVIL